jgi:AcrR family transcriptional regulator
MTEQKLERRDRILEAARELIIERAYREITVRDLARHCGVSVPTLYNQFGGKDALLAAAVESHFRAAFAEIAAGDESLGPARILGLVHRVAVRTTELADYHRSLLKAFVASRETEPLQQSLGAELTVVFVRELEEMRSRRQLASWIDPGILAVQITTACISASVVWGQGLVGDKGLDAFMHHGVAVLLLAAARGKSRTELEAVVRDAQKVLAVELTATAARNQESTG